jgi:uncharacterized protein YraI
MRQKWLPALGAALLLMVALIGMAGVAPAYAQGITGSNWRGFYWNNNNFQGGPVLERVDPAVNFNWATGSPGPNVPADNFSVRWVNQIDFTAGTYRFRAGADDGIRVAINGNLIIDRFTPAVGGFQVNTADVALANGRYEIIIDYYEGLGEAGVLFDWTPVTAGGGTGTGGTGGGGITGPAPTATAVPRVKAVVIVDRAKVRSGPATEFPTIAQVALDQQFIAIGRNGDFGFETWYLVDLGGGAKGWLYRQVIYLYGSDPAALPRTKEVIDAPAIAPADSTKPGQPPAVGAFEVRGTTINNAVVRDGPSTYTGQRIGVIPRNQTVQILKLSTNQAWVFVDYNGLQGWVFVPSIRVTVGRLGVLPRTNN